MRYIQRTKYSFNSYKTIIYLKGKLKVHEKCNPQTPITSSRQSRYATILSLNDPRLIHHTVPHTPSVSERLPSRGTRMATLFL